MTDIVWGDPIEVNGVRPEWLADDEVVNYNGYAKPAYIWHFDGDGKYRLPADHPAYLALAKGFVPWGGGDEAPADWDGGEVLWSQGHIDSAAGCLWDRVGRADIIGYRKRTEQPAPAIAPELVERMVGFVRKCASLTDPSAHFSCHFVGGANGADERELADMMNGILAQLPALPDPDMELAKSIAGDVEAIALAIKAARENGK